MAVAQLVGAYNAWAENGASKAPEWLKDLRGGAIKRIQSLAHVVTHRQDLVRRHLGQYAVTQDRPFSALNTAFVSDGAFVHVPAKATIAEPIQLLFLSTGAKPAVTHPRNLVVLEREARASIVETYASLSQGAYWTNSVTEVVVGDA